MDLIYQPVLAIFTWFLVHPLLPPSKPSYHTVLARVTPFLVHPVLPPSKPSAQRWGDVHDPLKHKVYLPSSPQSSVGKVTWSLAHSVFPPSNPSFSVGKTSMIPWSIQSFSSGPQTCVVKIYMILGWCRVVWSSPQPLCIMQCLQGSARHQPLNQCCEWQSTFFFLFNLLFFLLPVIIAQIFF
jgi:hypothetical protein